MRQTYFQEDQPDAMTQNPPQEAATQLPNLATQLTALQGKMSTLHQENATFTTPTRP